MPLNCIAMSEEELVSLAGAVNIVSKKYANLQEMIQAHQKANNPDERALLNMSILVHIYLKVGKPKDIKDKIHQIWDGLCEQST